MDDSQFELLGVVHGDVEGAVKEVTLRMTRAAEEDKSFREVLAQLAAERGGMYAQAFAGRLGATAGGGRPDLHWRCALRPRAKAAPSEDEDDEVEFVQPSVPGRTARLVPAEERERMPESGGTPAQSD